MEKTTMQLYITDLKFALSLDEYNPYNPIYKVFIEKAEKFLDLERQQIEDAYGRGYSIGSDISKEIALKRGAEFYNTKYGG